MPPDSAFVVSTAALRRTVIVLFAIVVIVAVVFYGRTLIGRPPAVAEQIDRGAYQAVFLSTGQAFYGRLTVADAETYLLNDIYYLVTTDGAQRLIKRGAEVFGPRDPMVIPAQSVLFIENMRDDSEIVSGIRAIRSGQGGPGPTINPAPLATAPPATPARTPRPSASR